MSRPETVTDWHGVEAPASLDGADLHDGCPSCGYDSSNCFEQVPAGYYTCLRCFSTWAGEPSSAELVTYLEWSKDASPEDLAPDCPEEEEEGEDDE